MPIHIVTDDEVELAARVLADAFDADPVWSWVFADASARPHQLQALWGLHVRGALDYGWVHAAPGLEAIALWFPPGAPGLAEPAASELDPLIDDLAGDDAGRVRRVFEVFDANHPSSRPHYYLDLFGTDLRRRGQGIGMALLSSCLERIDADEMPAYLESSNPANLGRYESVGFRQIGSFTLPDEGPAVATMWREPSTPD